MDDQKKRLSEFLVKQMKIRKITARKVARMTGISYGHIGKIVRGDVPLPGPNTLAKLAQGLNLNMLEICEVAGVNPNEVTVPADINKQKTQLSYNIIQDQDTTTITIVIPTSVADRILPRFIRVAQQEMSK